MYTHTKTWLNLEDLMLSDKKDNYCMIPLIYLLYTYIVKFNKKRMGNCGHGAGGRRKCGIIIE